MSRPLLLIDVDGVISLFGFDPGHVGGGARGLDAAGWHRTGGRDE
ncbi:MAG: hypothetical protein WBP81_31490 [Solirubrobacteraceae bacterium]